DAVVDAGPRDLALGDALELLAVVAGLDELALLVELDLELAPDAHGRVRLVLVRPGLGRARAERLAAPALLLLVRLAEQDVGAPAVGRGADAACGAELLVGVGP